MKRKIKNTLDILNYKRNKKKDALNAENGKELMGAPMSVEFAKGKSDNRGGDRGG
jgi:hypothetical protein